MVKKLNKGTFQVTFHLKRDIPDSQRYPLNLSYMLHVKIRKIEVYASVLCELKATHVTFNP